MPYWAGNAAPNGKYYAPQFATDREWYDNTAFEGESELADKDHCHTSGQTWPVGQWLDQPYTKEPDSEALTVADLTNLRTLLVSANTPGSDLSADWKATAQKLFDKLGTIRFNMESN